MMIVYSCKIQDTIPAIQLPTWKPYWHTLVCVLIQQKNQASDQSDSEWKILDAPVGNHTAMYNFHQQPF